VLILFLAVGIEASKDGIRFSCQGDIGSGSVTVRQHSNVEKPENDVTINLTEPVSLTFSLKYLVNFCKASGLSSKVKLCLSQEVPLLVEYQLAGTGYLRFYLAPKVWLLYSLLLGKCSASRPCTDSYFSTQIGDDE
jgi:proliferating cell nuclear antigen